MKHLILLFALFCAFSVSAQIAEDTTYFAKENGQWDKAYAPASTIQVPTELAAALKKNQKARSFFETLTKNNRYAFLHRLHSAKKEETRAKRLALFIGMLERGETFH